MAHAPPKTVERLPEIEPGTILDGKLRVESVLGRGGMGVVYLAHHLKLDRLVALKLTVAEGEGATKRLLAEARAMARVIHENVIVVYDVGTFGDGVFIAMEYLDGGTVRDWLKEPRTWREVIALFVQAGRGLEAAHERGLVHRDFKPENVLLGRDGRVRVGDFGLALAQPAMQDSDGTGESQEESGRSSKTSRLTAPGSAAGTPAYMAPEQAFGDLADARSDQFSFCVSLFEGLFEQRPFEASTLPELLGAISEGRIHVPAKRTGVPGHIRRALVVGLSVGRNDRFPNMGALLAELARDPAATLRRGSATAAVVAGVAVATWAFAARDDDACAGSDLALEDVWGEDIAAKIEAAFSATEVPDAAQAWSRAEEVLAEYADAWKDAHRETCEATHRHKTQSAELLDLRMACLDRRRRALAATVAVLSEPDPAIVRNARAAASGLPELDRCRDIDTLREVVAIPADKVEEAGAVQATLALAAANVAAGHPKEGQQLANEALSTAEALGLPALLTDALVTVSAADQGSIDWAAASAHAQAGIAAATRAHDDRALAELAVRLVFVEGYGMQRPRAEIWAPMAEAWLDRIESPGRLTTQLENANGLIARRNAHFAEALDHFATALSAVSDTEGIAAYSIRGMIAETHRQMGDLKTASALTAENIRDVRNSLGEGHPLYGQELNLSAAISLAQGDAKKAIDGFERALVIREDVFGPDSLLAAQTCTNIGQALLSTGETERAMSFYQRSLKIFEAEEASNSSVNALMGIAGAYAQNEDLEHSVEYIRRAIAIGEEAVGGGNTATVRNRYNLAVLEKRRGRFTEATDTIDAALRDYVAAKNEDVLLGALLYALRGVLRLEDNQPEAALADALNALERLEGTQAAEASYRFEPLRVAGTASLQLGKREQAIDYLTQAVAEGDRDDGRTVSMNVRKELKELLARAKKSGGR